MCWKSDKVTFNFIDTPARGLRGSRAGSGHVLLDNIVYDKKVKKGFTRGFTLIRYRERCFLLIMSGFIRQFPGSREEVESHNKYFMQGSSKSFFEKLPSTSPDSITVPKALSDCVFVFSFLYENSHNSRAG